MKGTDMDKVREALAERHPTMRDADMPLVDRIRAAMKRISDGHAMMRVPVEATDPDIVLHDCLVEIERLTAAREALSVQPAEPDSVPWPTVTRYSGGASQEGIGGRVWIRLSDEGPDVEYVPAQPAEPVELGDRFMEILRAIHGDMPDDFADSARLAFVHATKVTQPAPSVPAVTEEMVNRFLGWRLPEDFYPDCGVSFAREVNGGPRPRDWWPTGTNLLTAEQARAMLARVIAAAPPPAAKGGAE